MSERPVHSRPRMSWSAEPDALRLLAENVVDYGIFMLDPEGVVSTWNPGAERIKGYRAEDIVGRHFSVFYPPEDVAAGKPAQELVAAAAEGRVEDEGWRLRKDGTRFWANVVITAVYDEAGELRGYGKVTRDLSERKAAEEALRATVVRLEETSDLRRRLLARLVLAQETERRRIASDIHDDALQAIVAVGMRLQLLRRQIEHPERRAELERLDGSVRDVVARMRNLLFRVRSPALDHGVVAALSDYLDQVMSEWGLARELQADLDAELPEETAVTIFRIVQEALTNVRKHARAGRVLVELRSADGGVAVRVTDDGIGIAAEDPSPGRTVEHFGLSDMRERAESAGGRLVVTGRTGGGTTVDCWLPLAGDQPVVA